MYRGPMWTTHFFFNIFSICLFAYSTLRGLLSFHLSHLLSFLDFYFPYRYCNFSIIFLLFLSFFHPFPFFPFFFYFFYPLSSLDPLKTTTDWLTGGGLSERQRSVCDKFTYIPQYARGGMASINVACASAVVLQTFAIWANYRETQRLGEKFVWFT